MIWLLACTADKAGPDTARPDTAGDSAVDSVADSGGDSGFDTVIEPECADPGEGPDAFADELVSFTPGAGAGYGQDCLPDVVLGPPRAPGDGGGSLDVLSLGAGGEIVLAFDDPGIVDGEGPDLLVFENPFTGWYEPASVAVSDDGVTWYEWPCDPTDADGLYPGCAGVGVVYSNPDNGVDPTDPEAAGGDAFDLADLGISAARYVRVRDAGLTEGSGTTSGFDLDGMAIVGG